MSYDYFCYDPDTGFETYNTPEGAKQAAEEAIDYYRDNADEGWNEEVCGVCWGKINQRTVETLSLSIKEAENQGISLPEECSGFSDYGLIDVLPDNHDRLVEENKRLRDMLKRLVDHDNCRKDVIHLMSEADSLLLELGGE